MFRQTSPIKWAGSKRRLLTEIDFYLPKAVKRGKVETYFEPFLGSGSVFYLMAKYYQFNTFILCDANPNIINFFTCLQRDYKRLIRKINGIIFEYFSLTRHQKEIFYYEQRTLFNYLVINKDTAFTKAALFLFLNKTGYNGLYRENQKGFFNVPFGKRYNIAASSFYTETLWKEWNKLLNKNVELSCIEYKEAFTLIDNMETTSVFAYCDPPYRPIKQVSNFSQYTRQVFDEEEQLRLAKWCERVSEDWYLMVSNSNPLQLNPKDYFFSKAYPSFKQKLVTTTRTISCDLKGRQKLTELLMVNYSTQDL